jgi:signal transduction histidine kinase
LQDGLHGERSVAFHTSRHNATEAVVSISDNGPGVPEGKLTSIFETFYTTKEQGSGLGLSIARTIVGFTLPLVAGNLSVSA